jgi:hypothetical protein
VNPVAVRYIQAPNPPWTGDMYGSIDSSSNGSSNTGIDKFTATFTGPPNKQVAVYLMRAVQFQGGKFPTPDTMIAALKQKHGPNPTMIQPTVLAWAFDEQGRPLTLAPAAKQLKVQCANSMMEPSGSAANPAEANQGNGAFTGGPHLTQASVDRMMHNNCRTGVVVYASISLSGALAIGLDVKMSENSEDTRDYLAMEENLNKLGAAQKLQQQKSSQALNPQFSRLSSERTTTS